MTKVLVIISDGVSLRNFIFSNFYQIGLNKGYEITFLNTTSFELKQLGLNEIKITNPKPHPFTTVLKNVRKNIELNQFSLRKNNNIYLEYLFPLATGGIKNFIKKYLSKILIKVFNSERGIIRIRKLIKWSETKSRSHVQYLNLFKKYSPDIVYNTSQRAVLSIAAVEAAKSLNIPTIGFIYSWDNLPKATLDVETDYFHVWSNHMLNELVSYHPFINKNTVTVTGTPQFEPHYYYNEILLRQEFYKKYKLNNDFEYICFSGDDITTSPKDPLYLRDLAEGVQKLNNKGNSIGIIFRPCPVDTSNRYDAIIKEYKDIIIKIDPIWKPLGKTWDAILPTREDSLLLANIAAHCKMVMNLGSSMVFDFAIHNKPCAYFNYNYLNEQETESKGVYVYNYVHFKSMPSKDSVYWINSSEECESIITEALFSSETKIKLANNWFSIVNKYPATDASNRIWNEINSLVK